MAHLDRTLGRLLRVFYHQSLGVVQGLVLCDRMRELGDARHRRNVIRSLEPLPDHPI